MDHVVMVQVHCPDLSLFGKFNAAYRTYFSKELPARAVLGSGPLWAEHFRDVGSRGKPIEGCTRALESLWLELLTLPV